MKIEKNVLKKLLSRVSQNVPKKTIMAIVSNVLVEVKNNKMRVTGTDLQNVCYAEIPIDSEEVFSFTVNCEKFKKALNMRGDIIDIKYIDEANEKVIISSGETNVELSCLPVVDFPQMPKQEISYQRTVSAKKLVDAINKVKSAISEDSSRVVLTGVYIGFKKEYTEVVATNGKRICRVSIDNDNLVETQGEFNEFQTILPIACINNLSNLETEKKVKKEDGEVVEECDVTIQLYNDKNNATFMADFTQDMFSATTKVIQGNYPNISQFLEIPNKNSIKINIIAADLLESMKFVTSFSEKEIICFETVGNQAHLSVNEDSERVSDSVIVDHIGGDFKVNFNPKYVLDILSKIGSNNVEFSFADSVSPFSIVNENFVSIVMPIRNA
jgi:DNA polymerase-3 subunit beta